MSPRLYHEFISVPKVWFFTMSPCWYHESLSNPCFHFYTLRNTVFRYTDQQITKIKKYKCQNYSNTISQFTEIQLTVIRKYQIPNWRNTTWRSAEIQMTGFQKCKWIWNYGWSLIYGWLSNVTSNSQTVRARELTFWGKVHLLPPVTYHVSCVN